MSDFVLYNYFRSSTSYRVRVALHHKGIAFEYRPVHLLNQGGEQLTEEYKKLNPMAEVPTLVHKGHAIAQSMAIIEYLDEVVSHSKIFPSDLLYKAKVRQFCENINCGVHPLQNLKVTKYLDQELKLSADQKQAWLHEWIIRGFKGLEVFLNEYSGQFCVGDELSAADMFLVPQVFSAERFGVKIDAFPKIQEINERCLKINSFIKAHPHRQPDTPNDLKIN